MTYTIIVPVLPRGKGAARHGTTRTGIHVTFKDAATTAYMAAIALLAAQVLSGLRFDGRLRMDIVAVFPRTKELLRVHGRGPQKGCPVHGGGRIWHAQKPDGDNIRKAVQDALAPWMPSDQVVCCGDTLKVYAALNEDPHLEIYIRDAPPLTPAMQAVIEEGRRQQQQDAEMSVIGKAMIGAKEAP